MHAHLAAHQVGEHLGDRQPEAGAAYGRAAGCGAAHEGLEHALEFLRAHAGAGILDLHIGHLARKAQAKHHTTFARELHGVAQQVDEDLPHARLVGTHDFGHRGVDGVLEGDAFAGRLQLEHARDLVHAFAKAHRLHVELELAAFDARDVKRALNQRQQMVAAAANHAHRLFAVRGHRVVLLEQLRIAEDAVQRRAQLVADGGDVAALGLVGEVRDALGLLQRLVGAPVRLDLAHQQMRLAVRLLLCDLAALVRQHQPPGDDAGHQQQHEGGLEEPAAQRLRERRGALAQGAQLVVVEQPEQQREQRHDGQHQQQVVAEAGIERGPPALRQQAAQRGRPLCGEAPIGLAQIVAARIERAAQRADRPLVGGAMRHVRAFVFALADHATLQRQKWFPDRVALADHAAARAEALVAAFGLACDVVLALRRPGDQRRRDEGGDQGDHRRERLRHRPEDAEVRRHRQRRRDAGRTDADRVDVVEIRALELDAWRRQPERLVDHQVGHHRHHPRNGDVRVQPEHATDGLEHVELHQQQRDHRVEHHPHDTPRVAVRYAREEVRPRERAGIGVGDIDLQLRHDDEQRGRGHRQPEVREHVLVGREVHLVRVDRAIGRHHVADRQICEQRAAEHLHDAGQHPARPADQHRGPPARSRRRRALGHEAQVVDLLAHLRDQRDAHRHRGAEQTQIEVRAGAALAAVVNQAVEHTRVVSEHVEVRQHQHRDPQRLRDHLQLADRGDAVRHQRQHEQRTEQIPPGRRDVEREVQRIGHHRGLEREEDERERCVDQRRDGRTDVAEAGAAGQEIHVDAIARRIVADRQAGQEDDQAGGEDRPERIGKAVLHQQGRAHGLEHEEGRGAKCGVRYSPFAPLAERARREAQRVVLHRLARDPAVVVTADLDHALRRFGRARRS